MLVKSFREVRKTVYKKTSVLFNNFESILRKCVIIGAVVSTKMF